MYSQAMSAEGKLITVSELRRGTDAEHFACRLITALRDRHVWRQPSATSLTWRRRLIWRSARSGSFAGAGYTADARAPAWPRGTDGIDTGPMPSREKRSFA